MLPTSNWLDNTLTAVGCNQWYLNAMPSHAHHTAVIES